MGEEGTSSTESVLEWLYRMELDEETIGFSGDEGEWESFVVAQFTNLTRRELTGNQLYALAGVREQIQAELGYWATWTSAGRLQFRSTIQGSRGQYISQERVINAFEFFLKAHTPAARLRG